ncbi:MAG: Wzz/FepE/Etk N-terminal domain-containing protein, partial [Methanothrix sp.]|nr:Wzz/FepE/Etk N-terminal domain-containing protein [Methanothrix sp.]
MEDEIDLRDIFRVLWKRRLLIMGVFVFAVLAAGVISFAMPPVYKVSSIIAVGNFEDPVYASQASMKSLMLSDEFLLDVFEEISPNGTEGEFVAFKGSIKVELVKDSDRLIEISVETEKKQEGLVAVETMIDHYSALSENSYNKQKKVLSDQLSVNQQRLDIINRETNQTQEALQDLQDSSGSSVVQAEMRFSRTLDILNVKETQRSALIDKQMDLEKQMALITNMEVVQPAREPVSPIGPRKALIVAIAGMLGLMIGVFAAFL